MNKLKKMFTLFTDYVIQITCNPLLPSSAHSHSMVLQYSDNCVMSSRSLLNNRQSC